MKAPNAKQQEKETNKKPVSKQQEQAKEKESKKRPVRDEIDDIFNTAKAAKKAAKEEGGGGGAAADGAAGAAAAGAAAKKAKSGSGSAGAGTSTSSAPELAELAAQVKAARAKQAARPKVEGSKDDIFGERGGAGARKRTDEGYAVYTEDELGLGRRGGGDTDLCPFDCECCY